MSIEDRPAFEDTIRSALSARAGEVAAPAGARDAIERGVVRARRRRAVGAGVLAVALLVGGGVMTASLLRDDQPGGLVTTPSGDATPTVSDTPSLAPTPRAMTTYDDPRGFRIVYPSDYRRYYFEGDVVIHPTGLPGLEQGEPTFGISFRPEAGANDPMDCQGPDLAQPGTDGSRTVDGEKVATCEQTGDDGDNWYRRTYSFVWPDQTCDHISMGCRSDKGVTLTVRMVGATKTLWERYLEDGTAIAESVRAIRPRPNEDAMEAAGAGSTEQPAVSEEQASALAETFMTARVRGDGAEEYLTEEARRVVTNLYAYRDQDYTRHHVGEMGAADASSWEASVNLFFSDGDSVHEILFIGYDGAGDLRVRGIEVVGRTSG